MIKIAICDDDENFRYYFEKQVGAFFKTRNINILTTLFSCAEDVLKEKMITSFDIVFLDVCMKKISGIEAGHLISNKSPSTIIVFVSGWIEFAPQTMEIECTIRYLLKMKLEEKLDECLKSALKRLNIDNKQFVIDFTTGEMTIYRRNILYVESNGHLLTFHFLNSAKNEPLTTRKYTLKNLQEMFSNTEFLRIDNSYLVNMAFIDCFCKGTHGIRCVLNNGETLYISQRKYIGAKRDFFLYKGRS